jgi:hypothetical protein
VLSAKAIAEDPAPDHRRLIALIAGRNNPGPTHLFEREGYLAGLRIVARSYILNRRGSLIGRVLR